VLDGEELTPELTAKYWEAMHEALDQQEALETV
jgi:hypothetical protein